MGWLDERQLSRQPDGDGRQQLARFHDRDYIAAIRQAEADQHVPADRRERYNIGRNGNPVFPEIFRRPATASRRHAQGGRAAARRRHRLAIRPAALITAGPIAPAASAISTIPCSASSRCSMPGLTRIYYVDVDAHHGDGVQDAFADDDRVFTLSIHETGRWPYTRRRARIAPAAARSTCRCPPASTTARWRFCSTRSCCRWQQRLRPEAVVLQCGADGLADDPMSGLALSNRALWRVCGA